MTVHDQQVANLILLFFCFLETIWCLYWKTTHQTEKALDRFEEFANIHIPRLE